MLNDIIKEDIQYIIRNNLPWGKLENKTVLITGANGMIAQYMVRVLIQLNLEFNINLKVIALVRNKEKSLKVFKEYMYRRNFQLLVQDVCDPINLNCNIDYIIHAASQASPKYYSVDPIGTLKPNIIGTFNLLDLARKNKVKSFLYFSSSEVYGEIEEKFIPTKESNYGYIDPTQVRSCYAESKRMSENMCICWFHQYGVPVKIVRPFHTYGPGMVLNDGRVFADFISDVVNNRNIILKSDGSATRNFCYLADAVSAFFTVLLKGNAGEVYNVSNDSCEISIKQLAELLSSLFSERNIKVEYKIREKHDKYLISKINRNCADISKIKALGWTPLYNIQQGFERTIRSVEFNDGK